MFSDLGRTHSPLLTRTIVCRLNPVRSSTLSGIFRSASCSFRVTNTMCSIAHERREKGDIVLSMFPAAFSLFSD